MDEKFLGGELNRALESITLQVPACIQERPIHLCFLTLVCSNLHSPPPKGDTFWNNSPKWQRKFTGEESPKESDKCSFFYCWIMRTQLLTETGSNTTKWTWSIIPEKKTSNPKKENRSSQPEHPGAKEPEFEQSHTSEQFLPNSSSQSSAEHSEGNTNRFESHGRRSKSSHPPRCSWRPACWGAWGAGAPSSRTATWPPPPPPPTAPTPPPAAPTRRHRAPSPCSSPVATPPRRRCASTAQLSSAH